MVPFNNVHRGGVSENVNLTVTSDPFQYCGQHRTNTQTHTHILN